MVRKFDRISIEFSMKFLRKKSIEFLTGISGSNSVMVMPPTHTGGRTQQLRFHACTEPVEDFWIFTVTWHKLVKTLLTVAKKHWPNVLSVSWLKRIWFIWEQHPSSFLRISLMDRDRALLQDVVDTWLASKESVLFNVWLSYELDTWWLQVSLSKR